MFVLPWLLACGPADPDKSETGAGDVDTDTDTDTDADADTDTDADTDADAGPVRRADIEVCGDASMDYSDIQAAIDASSPGDLIEVCPGTYGPIHVPWSFEVYITSTDGPDVTSIDAGAHPAVIVEDGALTLTGFHVTGTAFDDPYYPEGAAFSVHEGDLTVSDCHVSGTTGAFTVLFDENYLAMEDVVWEDNTTDYLWYLVEGINADVRHNIVSGGQHQTVVATPDLDNLSMTNNLFLDIGVRTARTAFEFTSNGAGIHRVYQNVFYDIDDDDPYGGRTLEVDGVDFRNNIVAQCEGWDLSPIASTSSLFWDNGVDYAAVVSGMGNLYVDPMFTDPDAADFTLRTGSPAIDAGDARSTDPDGTRSDIGMYGGPDDAEVPAYTHADTETITGTVRHTLTVADGAGDGSFLAGEVVQVWADVDPQTEIVTGWSGGTVTDASEWNSTFTMPDADVTLTPATATAILPVVASTFTLAGTDRSVLTAIPTRPRGLVLFFHSARRDNAELLDNGPSSVARRLYDAGYGIVAMDSDIAAIVGTGGWSDATDDETLDLAATRELLDQLAYWDVPVIAWGVGEGGEFAHSLGVAIPADAVVAYCAPGRRYLVASTSAATAWFMAERDSLFPDGAAEAVAYAAALDARGVTAEVRVHPTTPLYDGRFLRVTGIDSVLSTRIADALRTAGHVATDGDWRVTGEEAAADLSGLGLTPVQEVQVAAEIEIMAADNELYDDYGAATLAFLDSLFP